MKTVLITGANRGIGLALAEAYLERGDQVIATCRQPEKAEALQALCREGKPLRILPLEVTEAQSIAALAATLAGKPIDVLINNAGILSGAQPELCVLQEDQSQHFGSVDAAGWARLFEVNSIAPIMVTQALLPNLKQAKTRKIAMISSGWGSIGCMDNEVPVGYGSSKAALNFAMKKIAMALQSEGFIVVSLNPGWVRTDMGSQEAEWSPQECASRLVPIIEELTPDQTGQFIRHTGEQIPW